MTQKYSCKKESSFGMVLLAGSIIIIGIAYGVPLMTGAKYSAYEFIITSLFVTPLNGLLLWCWFDTYYLIDNETLIAKCGPFVWRISIQEIKLIRLNQKTVGGIFKPTLSWESMEEQYKTHRSIYVTPDKPDDFLSVLKEINEQIEIE